MQHGLAHITTPHGQPSSSLPALRPAGACRPAKRQCRQLRRQAVLDAEQEAQPLGLLLELDGCIVDTASAGHREAFNRAFKRMGISAAHWTPVLYQDLMTAGDGSAESMLSTYFGTIGWPIHISSKEKPSFLQRIHAAKQDELRNMVDDAEIPLRPGVDQLIRDALTAGARVGVLAATGSAPKERIAEAAFTVLPSDLTKYTRLFVNGETIATGEQPAPSLEAQMSDAKARVKQSEAQAFVRAHRLSRPSGSVSMSMAAGLHFASGGSRVSASWLQACALLLGLGASSVALVAAASSTMQAGRGAGLLTLAVPPPVSNRGTFQHANARYDGYGAGGGLLWRQVASKIRGRKHLYQPPPQRDMSRQ